MRRVVRTQSGRRSILSAALFGMVGSESIRAIRPFLRDSGRTRPVESPPVQKNFPLVHKPAVDVLAERLR
jgi:hypothetical protein